MKEEKSLVKTNNNIFSKMMLSIKRFFSRNKKNEYQANEIPNMQENYINENKINSNFEVKQNEINNDLKLKQNVINNGFRLQENEINANYETKQNVTTNINQKLQMNTELQDMKTLQQVMQGQVKVNNLEENTIDRLINLCSNRLKEVNKKIEYKEKEINKNKKLTTALKQV